jgi:hypothetical protein
MDAFDLVVQGPLEIFTKVAGGLLSKRRAARLRDTQAKYLYIPFQHHRTIYEMLD